MKKYAKIGKFPQSIMNKDNALKYQIKYNVVQQNLTRSRKERTIESPRKEMENRTEVIKTSHRLESLGESTGTLTI